MKRITTIILINTLALFSFSQNVFNQNQEKYKITGEITGLKDSTVILAYYFGGKQYATDTANVINGKFTFKGNKELKGGMYLIVLSESKYFDIIVSEQNFSLGQIRFTISKSKFFLKSFLMKDIRSLKFENFIMSRIEL